jgi:hypothetical protein
LISVKNQKFATDTIKNKSRDAPVAFSRDHRLRRAVLGLHRLPMVEHWLERPWWAEDAG